MLQLLYDWSKFSFWLFHLLPSPTATSYTLHWSWRWRALRIWDKDLYSTRLQVLHLYLSLQCYKAGTAAGFQRDTWCRRRDNYFIGIFVEIQISETHFVLFVCVLCQICSSTSGRWTDTHDENEMYWWTKTTKQFYTLSIIRSTQTLNNDCFQFSGVPKLSLLLVACWQLPANRT